MPLINGQPDLLRLWLVMYPGDLQVHINAINAAGIRSNHTLHHVTEHEYVRFWGMCIAARQFSERGKCLWGVEPQGIRAAPNFDQYMAYWRFEVIRRLVKEICPSSSLDPWSRFRPLVEEFNANRAKTIHSGGDVTADESISAYQPRLDKFGGLPNISFIKRKPKPLGTEFKTMCDTRTGVMKFMEIQEGKDAMRLKPFAFEFGVTTGCVARMAAACAPGTTMLGDSWFGNVKV